MIVCGRRGWIGVLLAGMVAFAASHAEAQDARRVFRIGVLNEAWAANHPTVEGLKAGLRELGLLEGRNVSFDIRFTEGKPGATPAAAGALVQAGVDLIFTSNEAATLAAKEATSSIPIVFTLVGDPVAAGIVASVARPGGNLTGVSSQSTQLTPKRLEFLKTMVPGVQRVWFIHHSDDVTDSVAVAAAVKSASKLRMEIVSKTVTGPDDVQRVLNELGAGDALVSPTVDTLDIPATLLEASMKSGIPAVFPAALWVGHGGLLSYGPDFHAQGVQAARLVGKILRGARPRDLPVEGADKIDLAVNLKTASQIGVIVPRKVMFRADVIRR